VWVKARLTAQLALHSAPTTWPKARLGLFIVVASLVQPAPNDYANFALALCSRFILLLLFHFRFVARPPVLRFTLLPVCKLASN